MPKTKREINNDFITFSKRLRELRESLNMTQKEFAEHIGFTQATLSAYENSLKIPSLDIVMKIASKCEISIDWLCGLSNNQTSDRTVKTYSDIISSIKTIIENSNTKIKPITMKLFRNDNYSTTEETVVIESLIFLDNSINAFLSELVKVLNLKDDNTFDDEMFEIWMEKNKRKYNKPIKKDGDYSDYPHFSPEDLPF